MTSRLTAATRRRAGFTLIELLTVIAIIGILAAILIPTIAKVRDSAQKTVDASNLRQIASSAISFAAENNGKLPGTAATPIGVDGKVVTGGNVGVDLTIYEYAAALAQVNALPDARLWVSAVDQAANGNSPLSTVLNSTKTIETNFGTAVLSYMVVSNLAQSRPSTTPLAFTRGLEDTGDWNAYSATITPADGVYGDSGGHIAFLGGNVSYYSSLNGSQKLTSTANAQTNNILETLQTTEFVIGVASAPLAGSPGETPAGP